MKRNDVQIRELVEHLVLNCNTHDKYYDLLLARIGLRFFTKGKERKFGYDSDPDVYIYDVGRATGYFQISKGGFALYKLTYQHGDARQTFEFRAYGTFVSWECK